MHVGALIAGTDLAAVPEAGVHRVLDGDVEVGVVEDYERRLAAELQRDRGDVVGGGGEDLAPGPYGAGDGDHLRQRARHERAAGGAAPASDDVYDAAGHPSLGDDPGDGEGRQRGLFV